MKTLTLTIVAVIFSICIFAQVNPEYEYVEGHYNKDGTYTEGYFRTKPNNTNRDNYSTKPNTNPWNGKPGIIEPDENFNDSPIKYSLPNYQTPNYQKPSTDFLKSPDVKNSPKIVSP